VDSSKNEEEFPSEITQAVTQAIENTFTKICGDKPIYQGEDIPASPCVCLAGIISFVGDRKWILTFILPQETAPAMALKFVGFEVSFDSSDMGEVVGELANVLAGEIVARLQAHSIKSSMSLPSVARGHDIELLTPAGAPSKRLRFSSPQGGFWFKLATATSNRPFCRMPGS
jgi:CheY-specific phosphatase CheX